MPGKPCPPVSEAACPLDDLERARARVAERLRLEPHLDVAALEMLGCPERALQEDRLSRGRHPEAGPDRGKGQPRRDRVERARAEAPGDDVDAQRKSEDEPTAIGQPRHLR